MNFLRLDDFLPTVLFEDSDILAIDKPYGFNSHTNDSKLEHSEFVQDGLIEIYEKHFRIRLHIIHRLDQTTTGVMIFGKSVEAAKKYAEFFFNRQVKKTYIFLTKSKSLKPSFQMDLAIVHKGKDLQAETQLSLLKKSDEFELWQAKPLTGRNHQIRIHAKAAQIPILGDTKYGGAPFPFLCLHNHQISFPNGIIISSRPPIFFNDMSLLKDLVLTRAFFEADRRQRLFSESSDLDQCFRLVHMAKDSANLGFSIDQFGKVLLLNWNREKWTDSETRKFTYFSSIIGKPIIVQLNLDKNETSGAGQLILYPEKGSLPVADFWTAKEKDVLYELRSDSRNSAGLFLNQRLQRNWLKNNAKGKSVLNLFSFSCSYSVAAAMGQASQVISVDSNKNALNWGRRNFQLNQLQPEDFSFFCRDSISYLEQCRSKNSEYDIIICDTPSFLKREKGVFKIKTDLEKFLINCLHCLHPNGQLLFSTGFDGFFIEDLRKILLQSQKLAKIAKMEISCILPSLDFELPDEKSNMKSFLIRI